MNKSFLILLLLTTACSTSGYLTQKQSPNFVMLRKDVSLLDSKITDDCGPEVLTAVLQYWDMPVDVRNCARTIYSPELKGTLSSDLAPYARSRGAIATYKNGSVDLIKTAIANQMPPIIMIDIKTGEANIPSIYHFFIVVGYSEKDKVILCKYYGKELYAITYEELLKRWEKAGYFCLEIKPSPFLNDFNTAIALEKEGKFDEAIVLYEKISQSEPSYFLPYVGMGRCYKAIGSNAEAEKAYRKAYSLNSEGIEVINAIITLSIDNKKNLDEAEVMAERLVQRYKSDLDISKGQTRGDSPADPFIREKEKELINAYKILGEVRLANSKFALAIAIYESSLRLIPLTDFDSRARCLYKIGIAYRGLGNLQKASESFQNALYTVKDSKLRAEIESAMK